MAAKRTCDRCGKDAGLPRENTVEVWDRSFGDTWNGVIWSISVRGNYMNSQVDICGDCSRYGLELLAQKARAALNSDDASPVEAKDENKK